MFQNILVPLDGSDLSARALPYAEALAMQTRGKLMLVRAAEAHTFPGANPVPDQVHVVREAEEEMAAACARPLEAGIPTEWHVYYGSAARGIAEEVNIWRADSIVMSTHGRGGLGKLAYGSVAQAVVAGTEVPVVLIPAHCQRTWPVTAGGRVLIPLDGSGLAERVLDAGVALAQALAGGVLLVGFVQPAYAGYGQEVHVQATMDEQLLRLNEYLSGVADLVRAQAIPCSTLADLADPASAINELAAGEEIVAIAMSTHGRTGLAEVVMGSVTSKVVHASPVPILVSRPVSKRREAVPEELRALHAT